MPVNGLNFYIDGPAAIYFGEQNCSASGYISPNDESTANVKYGTLLGYTDGGASISYQTMTHRINGDEYGGSEGMAAEQLILGGQATIRSLIVKWNVGAFQQIMTGANYLNNDGMIPPIGTAYFGSKLGFSFWVLGRGQGSANPGKGYYFPKCELATQPRQWNVSSLERRMELNVLAYCLFNAGSNGDPSTADTFFSDVDNSLTFDDDCTATFT